MLPLQGITVVSLEQAVAAPFATRHLADLGARVIKIERPGSGDFARHYDDTVQGMCSHFVWVNRSKESMTLDIKNPKAPELLQRLLARADVFIHNLAPGSVQRLGLGAHAQRQANPRLIVCEISGYGSSGPYRMKKAYDLLVQCEAGILAVTGTEETPSKAGISVADIAGGMYAYSGILTALFQRERTGEGAALEVSLFESLAEWMGFPAYFTAYGGKELPRSGSRHASIAPYGPFPTSDEQLVFLAVQNDREWKRFCEIILALPELVNDPRFASNSARVRHRSELEELISSTLCRMSTGDIVARLDEAQIANAQLRTMQEFWDHPQLRARNRWREVASPVGTLRALVPPVTIDGVEPRMDRIPDAGEDTEAILDWLGYSADDILDLRAAQVV